MATPDCRYFAVGACRSCTYLDVPYAEQLRTKQWRVRELLAGFVPESAWRTPIPGGDVGFRNRAKLAVGGTAGAVTLGILDAAGAGVDLRDCLIHESGIRSAIPVLARFLNDTGLEPYDVPGRRGELKYVHLTQSPSGELMVRFVVRSERSRAAIGERAEDLQRLIPEARVISVNLLPEHRAVLEGSDERVLVGESLAMELGPVALHLQPQSFFQTNTAVARALYAQAAAWTARVDPVRIWDLYCGVGGFALFCARAGGIRSAGGVRYRETVGIEVSASAVRSAERSASEDGIPARFIAGDATAFALRAAPDELPELAIVNPPRRGIGIELAEWLESSHVPHVIYSSCNPDSLARDLQRMPSYGVREARLFDMFPHTHHAEVMVLLSR